MPDNQNLFSDFPSLSKEKWENKVTQELKGQKVEDLAWKIEDGLELAPLYVASDLSSTSSFYTSREVNEWEIGEDFYAESAKKTNAQLLDALNNGVNAPNLIWDQPPAAIDFKQLLNQVVPTFISINFTTPQSHLPLLESYFHFLQENGYANMDITGSINGNLLEQADEGLALLQFSIKNLPRFRVFTISTKDASEERQGVAEEIAALLTKGSETIFSAGQAGIPVPQVASRIQFELFIGTSYFIELAKIRALKMLWPLVLQAYGVLDPVDTFVGVRLQEASQLKDRELNVIRASTQAMAAVLGGADRLTILPADAFEQRAGSAFSRRIARNIQHILKGESYFDRVLDPAKGSYYIEQLTHKIATSAWKSFQQMQLKK